MHENVSPPDETDDDSAGRYRTVEFADGLLIFDRMDTAGWIHADTVCSLAEMR